MLKPAPATTATSCGGVDESMYVFCIDVSGSMCVSKQVCVMSDKLTVRLMSVFVCRGYFQNELETNIGIRANFFQGAEPFLPEKYFVSARKKLVT